MNLLLLNPEEIRAGEAMLDGRRARHLVEVLHVQPGSIVRLGLIGGPQGRGRILEAGGERVRLAVELAGPGPEPPLVELIVALPRPIMLQRVLKQATELGLKRLHLIRSQRVEKSYFASPALAPEKIRAFLLEGMEQARDTWLPEVRIHRQFRPFMEDVLPGICGQRLLAHPDAAQGLQELFAPLAGQPTVLAIGPEGGWNDFELDAFAAAGFARFSMGPRILRVDTAVVALMAQVALLRQDAEQERGIDSIRQFL